MIQPFSAPSVAAIATSAIHLPQESPMNVPPQIAFAASANGDEVQHGRRERPEDGCPRDRLLGVLDLLRRNGRRLEPDERPEGERGGGVDVPVEPAGGRRERRVVAALDEEEAEQADDGQRHELQHRRQHLGDAGLAGAGDVHQSEQPHCPDRDCGREPVLGVHVAPEDAEVAGEGDGDRRVADPRRDPVGPGRLEADEVAERAAGEVVRPAGLRVRAPEVGEDEREQHRADAGEDQREDRRRAGFAGEDRRQREDARADHVADHECGGHPEAHGPLQARLRRRRAAHRGRRGCDSHDSSFLSKAPRSG
jgi:hypothetical protein